MPDRETIMIMTNIKTYSEMIRFPTFIERYRYLKIDGIVGDETFGYDRYMNQILYHSPEWRKFRRDIILRDNGCDLGTDGYGIIGKILIHHIEPITVRDIERRDSKIFDTENVISVSLNTHNAVHYGDESLLITTPITRTKFDTCPWRRT